MKNLKKIMIYFVLTVVSFTILTETFVCAEFSKNTASSIYSATSVSDLKAVSYALLDCDTGVIVSKKDAEAHFNVGYMSQLMTLFVVYESMQGDINLNEDTHFRVSKEAQQISVGRSRVFLDASKGEIITVSDAIKAVAICNAVDTAYALAEYVGKSEEAFVGMMNEKAKELGMNDTLFTDSTGIDRDNQYTCAKDLVILGNVFAERYPQILELTKITYGEFEHESTKQPFTAMVSQNNLTRGKFYPESDGFMVGQTESSGYSMLATVQNEGKRVVACVIGEEDENYRAAEIKRLLEYGLSSFEYRTVSKEGTFVRKATVKDGVNKRTDIYTQEDFNLILNVKDFDKLTYEVVMYGDIVAPVSKGTEVGEIVYKLGDEEVGSVKIVCGSDVKRANWFTRLIRKILSWLGLD